MTTVAEWSNYSTVSLRQTTAALLGHFGDFIERAREADTNVR